MVEAEETNETSIFSVLHIICDSFQEIIATQRAYALPLGQPQEDPFGHFSPPPPM